MNFHQARKWTIETQTENLLVLLGSVQNLFTLDRLSRMGLKSVTTGHLIETILVRLAVLPPSTSPLRSLTSGWVYNQFQSIGKYRLNSGFLCIWLFSLVLSPRCLYNPSCINKLLHPIAALSRHNLRQLECHVVSRKNWKSLLPEGWYVHIFTPSLSRTGKVVLAFANW